MLPLRIVVLDAEQDCLLVHVDELEMYFAGKCCVQDQENLAQVILVHHKGRFA
jgi:hypothetical protein